MSSSQQSKQAPKKAGGWFSSAIAGLESRLDTILADETDPALRARAIEAAGGKETRERTSSSGRVRAGSGAAATAASAVKDGARASAELSREGSRTRGNERLAERLARAAAAKNKGESTPGRVGSPVTPAAPSGSPGSSEGVSARPSGEVKREDAKSEQETGAEAQTENEVKQEVTQEEKTSESPASSTLLSSGLPINPARISADSIRHSETGKAEDAASSSGPLSEIPNGASHTSTEATAETKGETEADMAQLRSEHEQAEKQRQDEMHAHMERIDALQAKLQYLAKETVAAAKEANAAVPSSSAESKLAEKDEKIALLMEEGEKLSKNEFKLSQAIKKLKFKTVEEEKVVLETRKKLERAEKAEGELKMKLRRAEVLERQALERARLVEGLEKQLNELKAERTKLIEQVQALSTHLREAETRVEQAQKDAENKAAEVDKGKIASLENELEDAQIEKKLAEDRAKAEAKKAKEDADRQRERFAVTELELKNEIANLESRVEAVRAKAEEATSESSGAEGSVKLLRQVETLQSQYSQAKDNWETIEGSLNTRLSALERERDEATRRETDVRRKARDAANKTRRVEEELENAGEQTRTLERESKEQQDQIDALKKSLQQAETALADAKADFERQRRVWETEVGARIEEERSRWQRSSNASHAFLRTDSSLTPPRKGSTADPFTRRQAHKLTTHDLALHNDRPPSHRSPNMPMPHLQQTSFPPAARYSATGTPDREHAASPALSRQESLLSFDNANLPPTPSIEVDPTDYIDDEHDRHSSSPHRTLNDLVSVSTAAAGGPSVQLVERMSAAVRRLESEKAAHKEELARLAAQRDDARDQVVVMMRESDGAKAEEGKVGSLEKELGQVRARYEAALEMLGEKEEENQDLKQDVSQLKTLYKELADELGRK